MLRIGIIGCGNIFIMHSTSVENLPDAKIVGVCDIKKDRAETAAKKCNCTAYYDYKELINKDIIDVVHICVPHYLHPVITRYALEQGVNVLCEKPMAIKMEDALYNVALAEKNNLKYGVIFQCRFNDSAQFVKNTLLSGKLGKIISARVVLSWYRPDSYYSLSDWKGTWAFEGGGVIINQAIHSLDLANWFIDDEPVSVQANLCNRGHDTIEVEDTGEGFIRYKNGATLSFWATNNYGCDEPIEIRLFCEKGKVVMTYDDATITLNSGEVLTAKTSSEDIQYNGGKDYWGFQHIREIADFYNAVITDTEPKISGKEALKIQKLICEIYDKGRNC